MKVSRSTVMANVYSCFYIFRECERGYEYKYWVYFKTIDER